LDTKDKGVDDLFTAADIQSQQLIMGLLRKHFGPKLSLVGEEDCDIPVLADDDPVLSSDSGCHFPVDRVPAQYQNASMQDLCVFIDPLDATKEFTEGNLPAVMSLVGIGYKGEAVAGVMYLPFVDAPSPNQLPALGRTIFGMDGVGAFGFNTVSRNDGKFVIATTRTHGSKETEKAIEMLKPQEVVRVGGAGHKALLVLEGKVDAYVFPTPGTKKWDTCAPEAILRAVGGSLTDVAGMKYDYSPTAEHPNKRGVLCSLKDHQRLVDALKSF